MSESLAYPNYVGLLEVAGDGIFSLNTAGRCTYINPAALDLLGYRSETLLGEPLLRLICASSGDDPVVAEEESAIYQVCIGSGRQGVQIDDELLVRKDGTSFPVSYSASPLIEAGEHMGVVVVFRDITEARSVIDELCYLAMHDTLTGLLNRHTFEQRVGRYLQRIRGTNQEAALCYLDLDSFKFVNDNCGHTAGDELLRQLGDLMRLHCRQSDALGRLGGDEFGLFLQDCQISDAFRIVSKIRRAINNYRFVWRDNTYGVTVSVGLVALSGDSESVAAALGQADEACYLAKEHGRNRVRIYQDGSEVADMRRTDQRWLKRIGDALDNDKFTLSGQLIVALTRGNKPARRAPCIEVLVRMADDEMGLIPPGAFIPVAERHRIMPLIDRWVIRHSLSWLVRNPQVLAAVERVHINLSALSLVDESMLADIVQAFDTYPVSPAKLAFEIGENAAVASLTRARAFMADLNRLGCKIVLDRCGGGLSSVSHLKELPLDIIKFDGHFTHELESNPVGRVMVEALTKVAHLMGFKTIAFEIENRLNISLLQNVGVDFAQGIGIAEPRPLSDWRSDDSLFDDSVLINEVG